MKFIINLLIFSAFTNPHLREREIPKIFIDHPISQNLQLGLQESNGKYFYVNSRSWSLKGQQAKSTWVWENRLVFIVGKGEIALALARCRSDSPFLFKLKWSIKLHYGSKKYKLTLYWRRLSLMFLSDKWHWASEILFKQFRKIDTRCWSIYYSPSISWDFVCPSE